MVAIVRRSLTPGLTVCCNFLCTHSMYLFNLSNPGTSLIIKIALVNFRGKSDRTRKWHMCAAHIALELGFACAIQSTRPNLFKERPVYSSTSKVIPYLYLFTHLSVKPTVNSISRFISISIDMSSTPCSTIDGGCICQSCWSE